MSRFYEMSVEVSGHDPAKVAEIQAAAEQEWPFDDWWFAGERRREQRCTHPGRDNLCGGETEEEFTERLSLAIWRANGGYCHVSVDATYLENLPYETHELDEADYARLIQDDRNSSTGDAQT